MGWGKDGYYYRTYRRGRRVVRKYIGGGELGQLAELRDLFDREARQEQRQRWQKVKADMAAEDHQYDDFFAEVDALVTLVYLASGYRKHKGEWRHGRKRH